MKKSEFIEVLREPIATPFAFTKGKKDNRAVKTMKGFGYTKVERPKRPSSTKLVDYRQ
jgi:hypothetical protein